MVSLRPLLRLSRALGRQVFPVDGSGGTHMQDEGRSVRGTELRGSRGQGTGAMLHLPHELLPSLPPWC